ncbi:MAG: class I SAM-dependent methyltransferase [Rhodobacteraceae bacterium]|uniref:class I SAM-dependent methyltransferase n=1 Tax=Albidovulum sp. TaxID=1872424 RepID=UPI001D4259BE|nr:class I SAM-dependent methyltransferase [uncultured Defluviimonas sp.]MCB2124276.1 class I SAM-dependent methyltransferase [Paracoccaceae bacterium]MCC0070314.1 class I SAM-dependent methyltransferase [Paracoccaceae bacterium]
MELAAVKTSYRYWAPIYDYTFGRITGRGRRRTVDYINRRAGRVLEIGVGTGLSLDRYATHLQVTGIDVSADMLDKARRKVAERKLAHVVRISEMDARTLAFPDGHFDTVVAMHVISVVPEPEKVMEEMARVCKPGGEVLIVGHFARDKGFLAALERLFAPLANVIGWHSDFELGRILGVRSLEVTRTMPMPPFGIFTFLIQRKAEAARAAA